jgi:branched-chain amino acid aminotransferase
VVAPVGTIKLSDDQYPFGDGQPGPNTLKLREALTTIQTGTAADTHNWMTTVTG